MALEKAFTEASAAKINDYVVTKQVARVVSQIPAPGTPVIEGMTIQVKTVSLSDVPFYVLDEDAPVAIRNKSLAEIEQIILADDTLKAAAASGTVSEADRTLVTEKLSSGLAATITPDDADAIVKSVNLIGLFRR